ncbi:MAG: glycosyl hydrolase [Clostridia bacterium]|nr:glycosyl hydrolase [Clostridia bacterium]
MSALHRTWHIDVLHHSHTDIGYTARQELICRHHADFLRQAVHILRKIDAGEHPEQQGFRWQCENYWQVENFLRGAGEGERADLIRYVREGRIGLSASYLNLTDLVDETVLREHLRMAADWAEGIGAPMKSAMTADINGYSAGLPDALAEAGVKYLYSAVHTHHGRYPLHENPAFFRWRGPGGKRVLVFSGEHYHWGHVLGLCPHGLSSFMLNDDILQDIESGRLLTTDAETTEREEMGIAIERITRYLASMEEHGWPLDFVPVFVSGILSDNSPPNGRVAERVNRLNEAFGGQVTLGMTTLDAFFEKLEKTKIEIPEYAGDWTDWWADGVGSTPEAVKLYREAQRSRNLAALLDPEGRYTDTALWRESGRQMMLYAEHTWGHSASVSNPYLPLVASMHLKKTGYAVSANNAANALLDGVLEGLGSRAIYPDRPGIIRALNPWPFPLTAPVTAPLLGWEYPEGRAQEARPLALADTRTGERLPTQTSRGPRGRLAETVLTLNPGESRELRITYAEPGREMPAHTVWMCADAMRDQAEMADLALPEIIDTDWLTVRTDPVKGIASMIEKRTGTDLLSAEAGHGAFTCIYAVTPTAGPRNAFRRKMGRRRQTVNTREYAARPLRFSVTESGEVYVTLNIAYALEGTDECALELKVYRHIPRLEACVRIQKKSCADPEEIQAALPFVTDGDNETWIDKTGCVIRPGLDQLPGTCQAFWCLQNGVLRRGRSFDLLLASPDAPLVSFGEDAKGPAELCDGQSEALNRAEIRSRIMNNYWETNFALDLGGWHEFRYIIALAPPDTPAAQLSRIAALGTGIPVLEM